MKRAARVRTGRTRVALAALSILGFACGGGGSSPTAPPPAPQPSLEPTPAPAPTPTPCTQGLCEPPVTNTNPVVRAELRVYLLFDRNRNSVPIPDAVKGVVQEPIPVGFTIRLDVTGRDAARKETNGRGQIELFYSDQSLVETHFRTAWQRDLKVLKPGRFTVYAVFDGVGSNDLTFTFVE